MKSKAKRIEMLTERLRGIVEEHGKIYMEYLRSEDEAKLDWLCELDEVIEWLVHRIKELEGSVPFNVPCGADV